jgi:hypothetical protein
MWRAPARRARDGDDGAQWWRRDGSGRRWRWDGLVTGTGTQGANSAGGRVMARRRGGRWSTAIASIADHGRERERADERDWVFSEMAGAREKGRARLTGGVGRSVGEGWSWRAGGRA